MSLRTLELLLDFCKIFALLPYAFLFPVHLQLIIHCQEYKLCIYFISSVGTSLWILVKHFLSDLPELLFSIL